MSRKNIEDIYPLTPMQAGILLDALRTESTSLYVARVTGTFRGELDPEAFTRALAAVIRRNPVLRTSFVWEGTDEPLQVVRARVPTPVEVLDLRALPEAERAAAVLEAESRDRTRGLDLQRPPLFRVLLLRISGRETRMCWSRHHLILDGWSAPEVIRETLAHYEAELGAPLPALPARPSFGAYVQWVNEKDRARSEAFFRELLAGLSEAPPLPMPKVDSPPTGPARGEVWAPVTPAMGAGLANLGARRLTPATLIHGAFALALQRSSRRSAVLFGTAASGRSAPLDGLPNMLGMTMGTLPVVVRWTSQGSRDAWLLALQDELAELLEHEHFPLSQIATLSDLPRDRPLFEALLAMETYPLDQGIIEAGERLQFDDLGGSEETPLPLQLSAWARDGRLGLRLQYDRAVVADAAAAALALDLAKLVDALVDAHDLPLSDLLAPFEDPAPLRARPARPRALPSTAAPSPTTSVLCTLAAEVLGEPKVAPEDDFFELGGHSILVLRLVGAIRKTLSVSVPFSAPFEHRTMAALAVLVDGMTTSGASVDGDESSAPIPRRAADAAIPLTHEQEGLWFMDRMLPGSSMHNMPFATRIVGPLDREALVAAFRAVWERHEVLRANFVPLGESAEARPGNLPLDLTYTDLSDQASGGGDAAVRELLHREGQAHFDLGRDPLCRVRLFRLAPEEHALVAVVHHMVFDGYSRGVLRREVGLFYAAFLEGKPATLPPLPIQYSDFAVWQRAYFTPERLRQETERAKAALAGVPTQLALPTDRPRPESPAREGAFEEMELPRELVESLHGLAKATSVSMYMVVLAAFSVVLFRHSAQDDFCVGSPIAQRDRAELEGLLGMLANILVVRLRLGGDPRFGELLGRVREAALDAYERRALPVHRVIEAVRPERRPGVHPLFQVLVGHEVNAQKEGLPGLRMYSIAEERRHVEFDLLTAFTEHPEGMSVTIGYPTALFDGETIRRLLRELEVLFRAVVAAPDTPLSRIPLLSAKERQELLIRWNSTEAPYPRDACLHELFEAQAALRPDAVAVVYGKDALTYGELDRRANQLARHLQGLGVGPGVFVGLSVERSPRLLLGMLGILKAGGAYVPLDPTYPEDRLAFMLEDSGARVLVSEETSRAQLTLAGPGWVRLDADWARVAQESTEKPASSVKATDLAYVMYTSGSTGRPKGSGNTHRALCRMACDRGFLDISPSDVVAQGSNASFDPTSIEIWCCLANGARLVGVTRSPALFPHDVAALLRAEKVSVMFITTAVLHFLAREAPETFEGLRILMFAGEAAEPRAVLAVRRASRIPRMVNIYGHTECGVMSTYYDVTGDEVARGTVPIGRPVANGKAYVLDAHGEPQPIGVAGELHTGGDGLAWGFWRRPDLDALHLVPSPVQPGERLFRTRDLGRYRADGTLEYLRRLDEQIKVRGYRIELGEVESALRAHTSVREVVVIAAPDPTSPNDRRLIAYVVPEQPTEDLGRGLRAHLRERLPDFMVPAAFVAMEALPLTQNGKVDRRALPAPEESPSSAGRIAPRNETEEMLALLWERLLGVRQVGVTDNFFELGGHSMLAARLIREVRATFGQELPMAAMFKAQTIAQLAELLAPGEVESWATLLPIQPRGGRTPFFAAMRPNVNALGYAALATHLGPDQPVFGLQSQYREQAILGPYDQAEYAQFAAEYIRAIKVIQPRGPYYLGGLCEGAHIAFEMTRQLTRAGEDVALFVVFDTWPWENTHRPLLTQLHTSAFRLRLVPPEERTKVLLAKIPRLARRGVRFVLGAASRPFVGGEAGPPPPRPQTPFEARMFPGPGFVPLTTSVPITVLRCKRQPYWRVRDWRLGWANRTTGGVEVAVVAGDHLGADSLLQEPHVRVTAALLGARLRRAQEAAAMGRRKAG